MEYIYIIMKHWNKKTNMGIQKAKHNLENNIKYIWHEVRKTFTPVFRYKREILRQMILFQPILSVHGHTPIMDSTKRECWSVRAGSSMKHSITTSIE